MKETKNYQVNRQEEAKVIDISNDVYDEEEDCEQVVVFNENEKDSNYPYSPCGILSERMRPAGRKGICDRIL